MVTRNSVRRSINSLAMRDGDTQESKLFSTIGKGLCVWLVWKHAELLIDNWEALFVMLLFLIAPDLIKKFITMRFGGGSNGQTLYTKDTHESQRSVSDNKDLPDSASSGGIKDLSRS